jgi:5'-deoxynucleotidase YfbR-like HD superfamily hydrolase
MSERWQRLCDFLIDAERLKRVERTAWISDLSRHENTAEHSWHLTLGLLAVARELDLDIDLGKAMRMAVIHDLCEIDAGDVSAYDVAGRAAIAAVERAAIARLSACGLVLGPEIEALWLEYEAQQTPESRWVRVLDRVLPFVVNLGNGGQAWKDRGITRSQVLQINAPVREHAPEIFAWMLTRIDDCVARGWLKEG